MKSKSILVKDMTAESLALLIKNAVQEAVQSTKLQTVTEEKSDLIGIDEVCKITKLSKPTIYSLNCNKQIPSIKRRGVKRLIFSRSEIENWLESDRPSVSESKATDYINNKK